MIFIMIVAEEANYVMNDHFSRIFYNISTKFNRLLNDPICMQISMDQLREAHVAVNGSNGFTENGGVELAKLNGVNDIVGGVSAVNRVWGGDKRLSLYGYTIETINMLILPMIQTK